MSAFAEVSGSRRQSRIIRQAESIGPVAWPSSWSRSGHRLVASGPGRLVLFEELKGRPEQGADRDGGLTARSPRSVELMAKLRFFAVQEPTRLDRGQLDDFQDDLRGDGHPALVVVPGPDGNPQPTGHLRSTAVSIQFRAQRRQTLGKSQLGTNRFRESFPTSHVRIPACRLVSTTRAFGAKRIGTRDRAPRAI